jgi:hypothetical protein
MTTVFLRYDNLKIYYPNNVLGTKPIMNFNRSPDMGEGIDLSVHVATPVEKLALLKERILGYVSVPLSHSLIKSDLLTTELCPCMLTINVNHNVQEHMHLYFIVLNIHTTSD